MNLFDDKTLEDLNEMYHDEKLHLEALQISNYPYDKPRSEQIKAEIELRNSQAMVYKIDKEIRTRMGYE